MTSLLYISYEINQTAAETVQALIWEKDFTVHPPPTANWLSDSRVSITAALQNAALQHIHIYNDEW